MNKKVTPEKLTKELARLITLLGTKPGAEDLTEIVMGLIRMFNTHLAMVLYGDTLLSRIDYRMEQSMKDLLADYLVGAKFLMPIEEEVDEL